MKTALALAALALAMPLQAAPAAPSSYQGALEQSAYVMGRCYNHLSDDLKVSAISFYEAQEPNLSAALQSLYYRGIEDSRINGLTFNQCKRLIAKSKEELGRLQT